jgi:hypothetical protein
LSDVIDILYFSGKNFVVFPENKKLKDIIDEVAKMVTVNGVCLEEMLKKTKQPILAFIDGVNYFIMKEYFIFGAFLLSMESLFVCSR